VPPAPLFAPGKNEVYPAEELEKGSNLLFLFPLADCENLDIACRKSSSSLGQAFWTWRMSRIFAMQQKTTEPIYLQPQ